MSNKARPSPKGTVEECLNAVVKKGGVESVGRILNVVFGESATVTTINEWCKGQRMPLGGNLIRLAWFLDQIGCELIDRGIKDDDRDFCRELIACQVAIPADLAVLVSVDNDHFMRVLQGKGAFNPEWALPIRQYYDATTLETVRSKKEEILRLSSEMDLMFGKMERSVPVTQTSFPVGSVDGVVDMLATLIRSAIPLAEFLGSDACSPEDRERLREKTSHTGPYNLGFLLQALCGERAREAQKSKGRVVNEQE